MLCRSVLRSLAARAPTTSAAVSTATLPHLARAYSAKPTPPPESEPTPSSSSDAVPSSSEPPKDASEPSSKRPRSKPDGLPRSAYVSSTDRRRNAMAKYSSYAALLGLVGFGIYYGREFNEEEQKAHPTIGQGWSNFFSRASARTSDLLSFYNEPPFDKLLPDPIPGYGRPHTLVISLEDLMIHSSWSLEHGWRTAKRPGLDYFLAYLFQYYEIVVFTNQPDAMAAPIIEKINQPPGYIMFPLFRSHTRYVDGKYVKDLNYLNRDLGKVVMLETNPDAWSANPDNTIKLPPWKGDKNDRELVALIPFLEYIAAMNVKDVRPIIKDFDGKHIPTEFARREELIREQMRKELGQGKKKKGPPAWLVSALGMKPRDEEEDVKTFMDIARERGQQNYLEMKRHWEENAEQMLKEQKEAEREMAEQMKTSLSKIFTEVGIPRTTVG
jgi:import inner membrane translocase subunit TIM50